MTMVSDGAMTIMIVAAVTIIINITIIIIMGTPEKVTVLCVYVLLGVARWGKPLSIRPYTPIAP